MAAGYTWGGYHHVSPRGDSLHSGHDHHRSAAEEIDGTDQVHGLTVDGPRKEPGPTDGHGLHSYPQLLQFQVFLGSWLRQVLSHSEH